MTEDDEVKMIATEIVEVGCKASEPAIAATALCHALLSLTRAFANIPEGKDEYDLAIGAINAMRRP